MNTPAPAEPPFGRALVWLRRDLRTDDHAALAHALHSARQVWVVFVFDRAILEPLPRADRRVEFIRESLVEVDASLRSLGSAHERTGCGLIVRQGDAPHEVAAVAADVGADAVFAAHDDDPYALERDARARGVLADAGVLLHTLKDHVVFERSELLTAGGTPYSVFTPYKNAWLAALEAAPDSVLHEHAVAPRAHALAPLPASLATGVPTLAALGFEPTNLQSLQLPTGMSGAAALLDDFWPRLDLYDETRDFPSVKGPSYLGVHLRFGTVSVRALVREARARMHAGSRGALVWLSELIWREFFHQVLHHHPHVVGRAFKPAYDAIKWEHGKHADEWFAAWCEGRTGYPIVDAAMLQLARTGYMHNRLRMIAASFLVKDLGIDWRRGEAWFALHLNDFDLAANNGGWQWVASTGCDAQPYFRLFNPVAQSRRFDPEGRFIKRYLPQLEPLADDAVHAPWLARPGELAAAGVVLGRDYPEPLVPHEAARMRTLERYAVVKSAAGDRQRAVRRR